ncbi:MAG: FMN-binding protein [Bacteroidia bacterium]|nr:MAG: FMN-binding protein [Bacteroidia bacterium]
MKKTVSAVLSGIILLAISASSFHNKDYLSVSSRIDQDTLRNYPDGKYSGQSRHTYIDEPYWGSVSFTLKSGLFTGIEFIIWDSVLQQRFDSSYAKYFKDNELYIQQCRNDGKGVITYPKKLLEVQDINKLDAVSGATWSYNIFKASVNEALKNTKINK